MDSYVTGATIKKLREKNNMTQATLAQKIAISDKTISKWETGKGCPDITLIEPLAAALGVSVMELLSGNSVTNRNRSFNMKRTLFYVCPVCGNIMVSTGETVMCCCGITLPPMEADELDEYHVINVEIVEDEYYVTVPHEMSREHNITFMAAVRDNSIELVKMYPEGEAEARFKISRTEVIYICCNRHGLFRVMVSGRNR